MDVLQAFAGERNRSELVIEAVRGYLLWRVLHGRPEMPTDDDDVDVRTYLMQLRTRSLEPEILRLHTDAIESLYLWAKASGRIATSPFDEYSFDQPYLSRAEIRRRRSAITKHDEDGQLAHLKGLNRLAEALNAAADVQTAFDLTLEVLVETIDLQTAWAFVTTESGLLPSQLRGESTHGFVLAAWRGLPPGLQYQNRTFLSRPPTCHCQSLLQAGRLLRAVNIVECSRLQDSANRSGDNQGLRFHASTPILAKGRLVGIINVATQSWQFLSAEDLSFLSAAAAQVAVAVERARLFDAADAQRHRMGRELEMARSVQASLLPRDPPQITGYQAAAEWRSAEQVAGDFYDWIPLRDGRWVLLIGDVTDKGAPAALYMAMVRGLVRSIGPAAPEPASLLTQINDELYRHAETGMFVTMFCAYLDPEQGQVRFANAGHNPPILLRAGGQLDTLEPTGPLLGVMEHVQLDNRSFELHSHDLLIVYTDGLTDARNPDGEGFDLMACATGLSSRQLNAGQALQAVMDDLDRFSAGTSQQDDITLWILGRS